MRVCSCVRLTMPDLGEAARNAETRLCISEQTSKSVVDASASPWPRSTPLATGALGGSDASPDISQRGGLSSLSIHKELSRKMGILGSRKMFWGSAKSDVRRERAMAFIFGSPAKGNKTFLTYIYATVVQAEFFNTELLIASDGA